MSALRRVLLAGMALAVVAAAPDVATSVAGSRPALSTAPVSPPPAVPSKTSTGHDASCLYTRNSIAAMHSVERAVGRTFDCAEVFNDTAPDWTGFEKPWFTNNVYADNDLAGWVRADSMHRRLVIGQELVPSALNGAWRLAGSLGLYDSHIRALARNLIAAGLGASILRLGHEMNGNWYHDSVGNSTQSQRRWARYFAHFVSVMRSVPGGHFVFDWNINNGYRPLPFAQYYPGDKAVDIIGIDAYDGSGAALPGPGSARWHQIAGQSGGVAELVAFARRHHKPLSFPEWGLMTSPSAHGAGDDPQYVDDIASLMAHHRVAYQSYFDVAETGLLRVDDAPHSLAAFAHHFGKRGAQAGSAF